MEASNADIPKAFLPTHFIGATNKGDVLTLFGEKGAMLQKIGVWAGKKKIDGMQFWLSNGQYKRFGIRRGTYSQFTFKPGELISSLSLWGDGSGTGLGGIRFTTSEGKFNAPQSDRSQQEYPIDVGSGFCGGVQVRAKNDEFYALGFIFLKPISRAVMKDVKYNDIESIEPDLQVNDIKTTEYKNETAVSQTFNFNTSTTITATDFWSKTSDIEFAFSVTVKAGVPEIVETETNFSLTTSQSGTYGMENSKETTESWTFPVTVPPNSAIIASLSIGKVEFDLNYTGMVEYTTKDGNIFSFQQNGIYEGVTYTTSRFSVKAKDA